MSSKPGEYNLVGTHDDARRLRELLNGTPTRAPGGSSVQRPSSPAAVSVLRHCRVKRNDIAYGTATTPTEHTYDLYPVRGEMTQSKRFGIGIKLVLGRASIGRYIPAENGSFAVVGKNPEATDETPDAEKWIIYRIDERPDTVICNAGAP